MIQRSHFAVLARKNAGGGGFDPSLYGTVISWLIADDVSGSDGDPVSTWTAATGSNGTAASGERPTLQTSEVNGHDAILFDGTDDNILVSMALSSSSATFFCVFKTVTGGGNGRIISLTDNANELDFGNVTVGIPAYASATNTVSAYRAGAMGTKAATDNAWHVVCSRWDGPGFEHEMFVDGGTPDTVATGGQAFAVTKMYLGARHGPADPWNGYQAEVLVYSTKVSDADVATIFAELGTKYNITIT